MLGPGASSNRRLVGALPPLIRVLFVLPDSLEHFRTMPVSGTFQETANLGRVQ